MYLYDYMQLYYNRLSIAK
uniref:Uncharacterized protein n=1 Tax=Anguilla anguilla TaxID=7936 RepID=A0A0E9TKF6_ANGAN